MIKIMAQFTAKRIRRIREIVAGLLLLLILLSINISKYGRKTMRQIKLLKFNSQKIWQRT